MQVAAPQEQHRGDLSRIDDIDDGDEPNVDTEFSVRSPVPRKFDSNFKQPDALLRHFANVPE